MRLLLQLFVGLATLSLSTWAANSSPSQFWAGTSPAHVLVNVDTQRSGVAVTLLKDRDRLPRSVGITFFDRNGIPTVLELQATEPWSDPSKPEARYTGELSPSAKSFVGFAIKIPFGKQAPVVIRSDELKKME